MPAPHIVFATHPDHGLEATSGHEQHEARALLTDLGWHPAQHPGALLPPDDADPQDAAVHATLLLTEAGYGVGLLRPEATTPAPLHLDTAEADLAHLLQTRTPAFSGWPLPRSDVAAALAEKLPTDPNRFQPLHRHRSADGLDEYRIDIDTEATWGPPDTPDIRATVIRYHPDDQLIGTATRYATDVTVAQAWLVQHGCPPDAVTTPARDDLPQPADAATASAQRLLRENPHRFTELDRGYLDDTRLQSFTLFRDAEHATSYAPFRVHLTTHNPDTSTYTVQARHFPRQDAAQEWIRGEALTLDDGSGFDGIVPESAAMRSGGRSASVRSPYVDVYASPYASSHVVEPVPGDRNIAQPVHDR